MLSIILLLRKDMTMCQEFKIRFYLTNKFLVLRIKITLQKLKKPKTNLIRNILTNNQFFVNLSNNKFDQP